jgi:hypothetical protein
LWDLHVREKDPAAMPLAEKLSRNFPENQEVARFLAKRAASSSTR